ncbi:MAG: site-specific integrase [Candidatus Methanosuratincola petrocarbonis]
MRTVQATPECTVQLEEFREFLKVDQHLSASTVRSYAVHISKVLRSTGPEPTVRQLRSYLATLENPFTYNNCVKALRLYFRDFLNRPDLIRTFNLCRAESPPPRLYSKKELKEFFGALDTEKERAIFLMLASSGRRRSEVLSLKLDQIDLDRGVIMPTKMTGTKRTWYSFFNSEAREALEEYLGVRRDPKHNGKLFPMAWDNCGTLFRIAHHKTGLHITPQTLRFWFANEMARLGVPDRFIDAFQGRIPRSVLARHYTDYSLENLKAIYDKAGLRVLG